MLDLDPDREPVTPKQAATVVVARDAQCGAGIEVYCVRRHKASGFMGGAIVFPGGKLDEADRSPTWAGLATGVTDRLREWLGADALPFAVTCLRETLEEAAILPVAQGTIDDAKAKELRAELKGTEAEQEQGGPFFALVKRHQLVLDSGQLEPLARWITPKAEARRYDTKFFLVHAPSGQFGEPDHFETTQGFWARPQEVLERWERDEIFLAPPTSRTLQVLAGAKHFHEAKQIARQQSLDPICPHLVLHDGNTVLALPGDALYPEARGVVGDVTAPTRFVLKGARFVAERKPREKSP